MSGHSKWSTIKHKKAMTDAKKANIFTKLGKLIAIAAKEGGNPNTNFKLKMAIDQARSANMPNANVERAIKKGTGELKGEAEIQEVIYEAYLPRRLASLNRGEQAGGSGNVAMLIKTATDNKNRTVGELKNILTKAGGKLVSSGSVRFMFKQVGNISMPVDNTDNLDEIEMRAIDAGAEDTIYPHTNGSATNSQIDGNSSNIGVGVNSDSRLTIYTKTEDLQIVKENLEKMGLKIENAMLVYEPIQKIELDESAKLDYEKLIHILDEQDDVQEIYDNIV
ncbi:putative transcriptional regulatory protein [bacterium BMS3Abin15]|nr:putative transcriptional regulatory protein [bacterium BMS3Abin15]HDH07710.1 YebC/PmpR family DNA-binding transcriptional regulator [Candidatus Moranbacteria bacterium]HDZ84999.1 YebC/PmpR family DNA-binding transcriptional regulator [Candidatus Moranbacteria bacterium]